MHAAFFGRTTLDVLYALEALPPEDTKAFATRFHAAPGGPACNAAITHALLGGRSTLISAIGGGPWAEAVRPQLSARGVAIRDLADGTAYEMPLTTILVNETRATRTIVNPPRSGIAIAEVPPGFLEEDPPQIAMSDGFHLEETLPALAALHQSGCPLVLDGGSWKQGTETLAPLLTVAVCSERFAPPGSSAHPETTLDWFRDRGVPHVAVTRGPRAILAMDRGRRLEIEIPKTDAVDTSGAGDVLHGAFCFYFAQNGDFESALRQASAIATRSCRAVGIDCWTIR